MRPAEPAVFGDGVFFREAVVVAAPLTAAQQRLLAFLESRIVDEAARAAITAGQALLTGNRPVPESSLQAEVETMPVRRRGAGFVVPMQWMVRSPAGAAMVVLDADVELEPSAEDESRIRLAGSYRPPFVPADQRPEPVVLAKVTDLVAGSFLGQLAHRVSLPEPMDL